MTEALMGQWAQTSPTPVLWRLVPQVPELRMLVTPGVGRLTCIPWMQHGPVFLGGLGAHWLTCMQGQLPSVLPHR